MDAAAIRRVVRLATGHDAEAVRDVTEGLDHRVFAVVAGPRREVFIVRVRCNDEIGLEDEAWAIERCAAAGVRVPRVRAVLPLALESAPVTAMVQDAVPGWPLRDLLPTLSAHRLRGALHQAGAELALIHAVAAGGFGRHRVRSGWEHTRWEDALQTVDVTASAVAHAAAAGLGQAEIDVALRRLGEAEALRCSRPVLCHMDYTAVHIFFDADARLTGVIDFGDFEGACPEHDHAFFMVDEGHAAAQMLMEGYRAAAGPLPADFLRRRDLACLRVAWDELAGCAESGERADARAMARLIREILPRLAGC